MRFRRPSAIIRLLVISVLTICCSVSLCAAGKLGHAPINPAFTDYLSQQGLLSSVPFTRHFGYIPPPVDLSYLRTAEKKQTAAVAIPPRSYDLRTLGRLTPIRDQANCGSCWAFATYGSLESCLMPAGQTDFSENNLKNLHGFDWTCCDGGNYMMSLAYLARWAGPVGEADDPYDTSSCYSPAGLPLQKHIQEVQIVPGRTNPLDNDAIKNAVIERGAVGTTLYWVDSAYNSSTNSYYYTGGGSNHAVCIVGWNDDYPSTSFASTPPGNGAFIIRNSWGAGFGDGGYFYVSYYDSTIGYENYVFSNAEPTNNYSAIYQYDPYGWTESWGCGSDTGWGASIYTATNDAPITAVGFYALLPQTSYHLYVYTDPQSSPASGNLASEKSGIIAEAGYTTVDLDQPVQIMSGQKFSVVLAVTSPGYGYPMAAETPFYGYCSKPVANPGETYLSCDGVRWEDMADLSFDGSVCLKAFAGDKPAETVATPTFTPDGGVFTATTGVKVSCATPGATIHYTTDGKLPTLDSPAVASGGTVTVDHSLTLKACAWKPGCSTSSVKSAYFDIRRTPRIFYVRTGGSDSYNGRSWQYAKKTVQAGINAASAWDEIWVAKGTYYQLIKLKPNVSMYGGFVGNESRRSQRNWKTNYTVLDGGKRGSVVTCLDGCTNTTVLDGFVIKNGIGTLQYASRYGGGIYCLHGYPTISNNYILSNSATFGGGIYYVGIDQPVISGNQIYQNHAQIGGGIDCPGSALITRNVIRDNVADDEGGGISCSDYPVTVTDNLVYNNKADFGGAISGLDISGVIENNTFANNTAYQEGGGLYLYDCDMAIANNIFAFGSSGIYAEYDDSMLSNNCAYGNSYYDYMGMSPGLGDIRQDPVFVSRSGNNFHIRPSSPCVDSGNDNFAAWPTDMDNQTRVFGSHVDIGVDECISPVNYALSPTSGTFTAGTRQSIVTTYKHPLGKGMMTAGYLVINPTSSAKYGICLAYDVKNNKMFLRDELDTKWIGGGAPGSSTTVENAYCKIYFANSKVATNDTTIALTWSIVFKSRFARSNCPAWMYVSDNIGAGAGWDKMGVYTVR